MTDIDKKMGVEDFVISVSDGKLSNLEIDYQSNIMVIGVGGAGGNAVPVPVEVSTGYGAGGADLCVGGGLRLLCGTAAPVFRDCG